MPTITESKIQLTVEKAGPNGPIRQWTLELTSDSPELAALGNVPLVVTSFELVNLGPTGQKQFYSVGAGQYGQPIINVEPDLAMPVPANLTYRNAAGEPLEHSKLEKLGGFIVADTAGAVIHRYSLTNARNKGVTYGFREDGAFMVNGQAFWTRTLFDKDKMRIVGYDGYFSPVKPEFVRVLELADLTAYFCAP